jgi:hypothetical protein
VPDLDHLCGWVDHPYRHTLAAQFPRFKQTALHLYEGVTPSKPILLYKAWYEAYSGNEPAYPAQQIGDCVSFGHSHANDLLQAVECILKPGEQSSYRETDTEFVYGASRKVGHMLGNSDGSYGAAAVKAMVTVGTVSREMLGSDGAYSGNRAKSWGRTGPPAAVEQLAAPFKLGAVALLRTTDDMIAALWNGYPCTICSNQGFTMQRDQDGFCRPQGHWGHCMMVAGYRVDRPGFLICQSWGPNTPSGPQVLGQPSFSFWCDVRTMQGIIDQADSWALFHAPDYKRRALPADWSRAA